MCQASSEICEKTLGSSTHSDHLQNAQNLPGQQTLALIKGKAYRRNNILEMLSRFNNLRLYLPAVVPRDVSNFPWTILERLVKLLKPFREVTVKIQKKLSNAEADIMIIDCLKNISEQETALH